MHVHQQVSFSVMSTTPGAFEVDGIASNYIESLCQCNYSLIAAIVWYESTYAMFTNVTAMSAQKMNSAD
jgi:hypothetical protein